MVRGRVLDVLASRFDVSVVVITAGAGFGKTTTLAQAVRANLASPRGIDAWLACEPGDEDAGRLSRAMLAALGSTSRPGAPVEQVLDAIADHAPLDVCLVIDDLHELPPSTAGHDLVRALVARLPANGHLVLAGREPPALALSRRRASGEVLEIDAEMLRFTDSEVAILASALGEDPAACSELAGWPSLVRLALSAPAGAMRQFLWEEVVAGLPESERTALLALAVLGSASAGELQLVIGSPVDLDQLVTAVPLVSNDGHGRAAAHALWSEAVERIYPAAAVLEIRRRSMDMLRDQRETIRLGSAAVRWRDAGMFDVACLALVRECLGALPIDIANRWLASAPADSVSGAPHALLSCALRTARRRDAVPPAELDRLIERFVDADDIDGEAVAVAFAAVAAYLNGDQIRLITLAERCRQLLARDLRMIELPELRFLVDSVDAAVAALAGDVNGSLRVLESMSFDGIAPVIAELVVRLRVTMLLFAGRADEAVEFSAPMLDSPHAYVRTIQPMVRWHAGDPSPYVDRPLHYVLDREVNHRDRLIRVAHGLVVAASLGDRALAETMRAQIASTRPASPDARDSAMLATSLAWAAILDHDEQRAESEIANHLDRFPLALALSETQLRRNFTVSYLCSDEVRRLWDTIELGPLHERLRGIARQFMAARAGELAPDAQIAEPGVVLTALPLPWSVELAVRGEAAGCAGGRQLLERLASWAPAPVRTELQHLAATADGGCQANAVELLGSLPDPERPALRVDVLGPLRLQLGDVELTGGELRRGRVRALLALLVVRGPTRRETICDLLWPDLEAQTAAQNLRVTLSRLRRLVAPAAAGSDSSIVRAVGDSVELTGTSAVETDIGLMTRHVHDAAQARDVGDSDSEILNLRGALALWRGDPLPDLDSIDELAGEVDSVRRVLVDAALRLGEVCLVAGRFDESLAWAERARRAAPYSERAHRLVIAAQLQRHDLEDLAAATRTVRALLDDLGVEPEPATQMLLRRADSRLGAMPE